jgi:hypothetical protein
LEQLAPKVDEESYYLWQKINHAASIDLQITRKVPPVKKTLWVAYHDIKDYPRQQFEVLSPPPPRGVKIKDKDGTTSELGYKDVHVKWHTGVIQGVKINLVTYTETPVNEEEVKRLLEVAFRITQQ